MGRLANLGACLAGALAAAATIVAFTTLSPYLDASALKQRPNAVPLLKDWDVNK